MHLYIERVLHLQHQHNGFEVSEVYFLIQHAAEPRLPYLSK